MKMTYCLPLLSHLTRYSDIRASTLLTGCSKFSAHNVVWTLTTHAISLLQVEVGHSTPHLSPRQSPLQFYSSAKSQPSTSFPSTSESLASWREVCSNQDKEYMETLRADQEKVDPIINVYTQSKFCVCLEQYYSNLLQALKVVKGERLVLPGIVSWLSTCKCKVKWAINCKLEHSQ